MLNPNQIGVTNADGSRRLPEVSAISGKPIQPGDATIPLSPQYFVMVRGAEWRDLSPEDQLAIRAEFTRQLPSSIDTSTTPAEPALESLSSADLDALASTENIDLTGRKSKADKIDAIRAVRVVARFGDTPVTTESEATNG